MPIADRRRSPARLDQRAGDGALPGTGGDIAALIAYDHATEGLVAPETANNAAVGGAFIPMLTLGIPGDAVTAIMIGRCTSTA